MPVQTKPMSVLFFRTSDGFAEGLKTTAAIADSVQRVRELKGVKYRAEKFGKHRGHHHGDVVRVRDSLMPGRTRLDQDGVQDLPLREGDFIGEETAFLFDPRINVIALQSNRFGISASLFAQYFQSLLGTPLAPMELVLDNDLIAARLDRFDEIRKLEVDVAMSGPEHLSRMGLSGNALVELMGRAGANRLKLVLQADRGGALSHAKELAKKIFRFADHDDENVLTKARLEGLSDAGEKTILDLLESKMFEGVTLRVEEGVRRVPYNARLYGLQEAYGRREEELLERFR